MISASSTNKLIDGLFQGVAEGTKIAADLMWEIIRQILIQHWLLIAITIFIVLVIATIKAMLGRWGMLGSVLYNLLYFGTLLIIVLIWGPEVFVENWFSAFTVIILYPACYFIVGLILDKTGLK